MSTQIFVNLPVADLPRSLAFFSALGYAHNPAWSDHTAACIVISEHIHVMLLTLPKFREFTTKTICDAGKSIEVINCLTCESREQVDDMVRKALAAGGSTYAEPKDAGFMYQHSFADPDGHCWELVHMSPGAICPETSPA